MSSLKNLYRKLHRSFLNSRSKKTAVSLGDVFHERNVTDINQFLIASRLLDVERFKKSGDNTFYYQNTISRATYGEKHNEKSVNITFAELIGSFEKNGYDPKSLLTVDKSLRISDGTHRFALCIYNDVEPINVRVLSSTTKASPNTDKYYLNKLESSFICEVLKKADEIRSKLIDKGDCFGCFIDRYDENLISDLKVLTNLRAHDEIKQCGGGYYLRFTLSDPYYFYEDGIMKSQRIKALRKIMRVRYPDINVQMSDNCLEGLQMYRKYFC